MLETAIVAARLAGQRAMEELRYVHKTIKNGKELVTQADPICQKIIIDRIRETYPEHGFIAEEGEEGKLLHIPPRSGTPIWWIVDPIDGTNNFANGILCFSVSIAAVLDGKPILGVIFEPSTDAMYTAALDMDARLNGSRITIEIGKQTIMEQTRYRCLGSTALHMAYVARGAMIGMIAPAARLWDMGYRGGNHSHRTGRRDGNKCPGTITNASGFGKRCCQTISDSGDKSESSPQDVGNFF
jgi:myo-inositol-1(or 4)-monophosphatase